MWRNDGQIRVSGFRGHGELRNLGLVVRSHFGVTPGIMVMGCNMYWAQITLSYCQWDSKCSTRYKRSMDPVLLSFIAALPNAAFQQDNARSYVAVHTREFFQRHCVPLLPWPARLPDLNAIEHVWDSMGRRLRSLPHPPTTLGDF